MNMDTHVGPLAKRLMSPPGWPTFILLAIAILLSLWAAASPMPSGQFALMMGTLLNRLNMAPSWFYILSGIDVPEVRILWAVLAWIIVFALWLPRRIIRGVTVMKVSSKRAATFSYWRRWLMPWFLLGATVLVCLTPAPIYVGFWLSKPAFERLRARQAQGNRPATITAVGIYPHRDPYAGRNYRGDPTIIQLSNWGGFVHSPTTDPEIRFSKYSFQLRYLGAGWYSFERKMP
jgi:hypothetical protein